MSVMMPEFMKSKYFNPGTVENPVPSMSADAPDSMKASFEKWYNRVESDLSDYTEIEFPYLLWNGTFISDKKRSGASMVDDDSKPD